MQPTYSINDEVIYSTDVKPRVCTLREDKGTSPLLLVSDAADTGDLREPRIRPNKLTNHNTSSKTDIQPLYVILGVYLSMRASLGISYSI